MAWLWIVLVAYFVLSVSNLADKIFLSKIVTHSVVYAVWVSLLSVVSIGAFVVHKALYPQAYAHIGALGELTSMTPWFIFVAIVIGILFTASIYLLYTALQVGEASRVIPLVGGCMPIMIYAMTFRSDPLTGTKLAAFAFLVVGTVLISLMPNSKKPSHKRHDIILALSCSMLFAFFFALTHYLFEHHYFLNGIVWPRVGTAVTLIGLFLIPSLRHQFAGSLRSLSPTLRASWLGSQALATLGFLGQLYVISIPGVSVALVAALQSVQYVFLLVLTTVLSALRPRLLREFISPTIIVQKILALFFIGVGLYFISL